MEKFLIKLLDVALCFLCFWRRKKKCGDDEDDYCAKSDYEGGHKNKPDPQSDKEADHSKTSS